MICDDRCDDYKKGDPRRGDCDSCPALDIHKTAPVPQSASNAGLDALITRWKEEIKEYENKLYLGQPKEPVERVMQGRVAQLEECVEALECVLFGGPQ